MHKRYNGYFTVEASFILPVVLFLYLLIILAALFLYCRCAISQDSFLLGMRAGKFSRGEEQYGEIIYGEGQDDSWQAEDYVQKRFAYKRAFYPFYPAEGEVCRIRKENVSIQVRIRGSGELIVKNIQRSNPVEMIREGRKRNNA